MDASTIESLQNGVSIAAADAEKLAPVVGIFNPGISAAMTLLTPLAATFLISAGQMVINFKTDMTPAQMVEALNASKSINWPVPPSIAPTA